MINNYPIHNSTSIQYSHMDDKDGSLILSVMIRVLITILLLYNARGWRIVLTIYIIGVNRAAS